MYPPLLDEAGLGPALREVAGRAAVPVQIDAPDERFGAAVEGAAYFALLGCLPGGPTDNGETVANRSAPAWSGPTPGLPIDVVIRREGDTLLLLVTGVDACQADIVLDAVRLLGGSVTVGGEDIEVGTARGAKIAVEDPMRVALAEDGALFREGPADAAPRPPGTRSSPVPSGGDESVAMLLHPPRRTSRSSTSACRQSPTAAW